MASEFKKDVLSPGNGKDHPEPGDEVTIEYTGWLHEAGKPDNKGKQFDSSVGRGDFKTLIGRGRVIPGWDKGVPQMSLGEKARLTIPGNMAYGARGFPGLIPPNSTLILE
jgi:FK506-binding protein 1